MYNRIYIVGPVGSGKSTLARALSKEFGFYYCELDSVVHEPDPLSPFGNRKRTEEERDKLLNSVLQKEKWIVEDAGRACFDTAMQKADSIILLEPPVFVRYQRILLRWIKQNLHLEKCRYTPTLQMLKSMFRWTINYERGSDGLKARLVKYKQKISSVQEGTLINILTKK